MPTVTSRKGQTMAFANFVLTVFDPFGIVRNRILKPTFEFTERLYDHYRTRTKEGVLTIRDLIIRMGIVALAIAIIVWTAVFMYVAFYYTYMPAIAHTRPAYMQFETCSHDTNELCSFPHAHISLTKKQQLLMVGQSYRIILNIDLPESLQNQKLGMFLVCADLRDSESKLRGHSCRSTMLRYKSSLLQMISTWVLSPFLLSGVREEHQILPVELFASYNEEQLHPVTDVYIEIQSKKIELYSVSLHIIADFTGLRYIMFHWPIVSAVLGISTNLFFIVLIFLLSWYHWADAAWISDAHDQYEKYRKTKSDLSTTTIDDTNNILDDDDLSILEEKSSNKSDDIEEVSGASGIEGGGEDDAGSSSELRPRKLTQTEYGY